MRRTSKQPTPAPRARQWPETHSIAAHTKYSWTLRWWTSPQLRRSASSCSYWSAHLRTARARDRCRRHGRARTTRARNPGGRRARGHRCPLDELSTLGSCQQSVFYVQRLYSVWERNAPLAGFITKSEIRCAGRGAPLRSAPRPRTQYTIPHSAEHPGQRTQYTIPHSATGPGPLAASSEFLKKKQFARQTYNIS